MTNQVEYLTGLVNVAIPEVYQKGMSYYEVLTAVVNKVNELIEQSNDYFSESVQTVMTNILLSWKADGTLDAIVSDAILDIGDRQYTEQNYVANDETVTASIDKLDISVSAHVTELEKHRNIYISETPPTVDDGENGDIFLVQEQESVAGSFTPVFKFGGDDNGLVYGSQQHGLYYTIGNLCYFILSVRLADRNNLTGIITIENLPLTASDIRPYSAIGVSFSQQIAYPAGARSLYGLVQPNTTTIELRFNSDTTDIVANGSMCQNGGFFIRMQGMYRFV